MDHQATTQDDAEGGQRAYRVAGDLVQTVRAERGQLVDMGRIGGGLDFCVSGPRSVAEQHGKGKGLAAFFVKPLVYEAPELPWSL